MFAIGHSQRLPSPLLTLALIMFCCTTATAQTGGIHGSVYTPVIRDRVGLVGLDGVPEGVGSRIYVPQFEVFLTKHPNNSKVASTKTDLFGRYYFRYQPAGEYRVCWDAPGWIPGCSQEILTIKDNIFYAQSIVVEPNIQKSATIARGAIWGRVALADNSSPYFFDEYFGVKRTADITITDLSGNKLSTTVANAWGLYIAVNVPLAQVRATAKLDATHSTLIAAAALPGSGGETNFQLPNKRPIVSGVVAKLAGTGVREAPQGAQLNVTAEVRDPDGDPLTFTWKTEPGAGQVVSSSGNSAVWQLANAESRQTLYMVVSDGKGGYASRSVVVTAGSSDVAFSGRAVTLTGVPIPKPLISINGKQLKGDTNGAFSARVPRSNRYVVNVEAAGFMPASRVFDQSGLYNEYKLVRATTSLIDPSSPSRIVATRMDENIGRKPVRAATIFLSANSLVDAEGNPAPAVIQARSATIDITNAEMPGDFGAHSGNLETNLISYGALFAEFVDASGKRYNLAHGKTAEVIIPAPPSLASPPATIALWSYNQQTGFWDDLKSLAKFDSVNKRYVGRVSHFSTINTDLSKTTAACLRVLLDNVDRNQLKAQVSYQSGGTPFAQVPEFILGDALNAIYRLPANTNVKITILDASNNTAINNATLLDANQQVLANNVINTGPPTTPLWPPTPYDNCTSTSVRINVPVGSISRIPFLSFAAEGTDAQAVGYYKALDSSLAFNSTTKVWSGGSHSTLGTWWALTGFAPDGSGGTRAAYLNYNDLGFGRDMHIIENGGKVFGYVTNYGAPDQNPTNADLAQSANQAIAIATVAMEFTPLTGAPGNVVKFFVFKGGNSTAPLVNSADLDGFGQKFVPNLCQNCHGGEFYFPANPAAPTTLEVSLRAALASAVGASFREFDTDSFKYPGGNNTLPAASRPAFFSLNQLVKDSGPQQAIKDLVDGWYQGLGPADPPITTFTPAQWIDGAQPQKQQLYQQVVSKSCRTCHISFDSTSPVSGITWTTYTQFQRDKGSIQAFVCGDAKLMPHALITYRNFWLSTGPHRPDVLGTFTASDWAAFANGCQ